jgi:hypothetical protein
MGVAENKAVVLDLFRAMEEGRLEDIARLTTEDATWWINGSGAISGERPISVFLKVAGGFLAHAVAPMERTFGALVAEGDRVCLEARGRTTFEGGLAYDNAVIFLLTLRDGRVHSVREYMDTAHADLFSRFVPGAIA